MSTEESQAAGSSPLARGLPLLHELRLREVGIIPARAGFTDASAAQAVYWADHPRSRGVYHGHMTRMRAVTGIIPARAGFTRRGTARP